jgi:hypothetical protein
MTAPVVGAVRFRTATSFLAALRRSHPRWDGDTGIDTGWVFRGQRDAAWKLVPSAFRPGEEVASRLLGRYLASLAEQYREADWLAWIRPDLRVPPDVDGGAWRERVGRTALRVLTHAALVRDFALLADAAGHRVRVPPVLWHVGNDREDALRALLHGTAEVDPIFAIAQHHGIPTGLLDWTYNPLVAGYFAAESASGDRIAVWAMRTRVVWHDKYLRRLTVPPQEIPFLDAQEGLFTWCPQAYLLHLRHGRFPTVEQLVSRTAREVGPDVIPRPLLLKLSLPASEAPDLLRLLWREKVSPAHLMPTFDNVTRALAVKSTLFTALAGPR